MSKSPKRHDPLKQATPSKREVPRCGAKRRNGEPCRKFPLKGTNRCRLHGGASPNAQRKARERLMDAADWVTSELLKIAGSKDVTSVKLAAIRDVLDRAGLGAHQAIDVQGSLTWDATFEHVVTTYSGPDVELSEVALADPAAIEPAPQRRELLPAAVDEAVLEGVVIQAVGGWGPWDKAVPLGESEYDDPQPHQPVVTGDDMPPAYVQRAMREGRYDPT